MLRISAHLTASYRYAQLSSFLTFFMLLSGNAFCPTITYYNCTFCFCVFTLSCSWSFRNNVTMTMNNKKNVTLCTKTQNRINVTLGEFNLFGAVRRFKLNQKR